MRIKTTYLQMLAAPRRAVRPPRDRISIIQAKTPTVAYYRFLYDAVGKEWQWASRKKLTDADLIQIIHYPQVGIHVLFVDGVPAGFAELDRRAPGEIEVTQFGLMPEFIGQGLGKYFLQWAIDKAWSYAPSRLWLHTCSLDCRRPPALLTFSSA